MSHSQTHYYTTVMCSLSQVSARWCQSVNERVGTLMLITPKTYNRGLFPKKTRQVLNPNLVRTIKCTTGCVMGSVLMCYLCTVN